MPRDAKTILAPGVPDLRALGAGCAEDLLGVRGALLEEPRAQLVSRDAEALLLRCPLPGTPGADGRLRASPCGAGTGFVYVRRYRYASWKSAFDARFRAPRSSSLGAREWNLLCALRAAGVATAEPMALVERGSPLFARESALVTRELEGMLPAAEWFAAARADAAVSTVEERRAVRALARFLTQLLNTPVELPRLRLRHLYIGEPQHYTETLAGLPVSALPRVALSSVRGGRWTSGGRRAFRATTRATQRLAATLEQLARDEAAACFSRRARWSIFLRATAGLSRAERRALGARIVARAALHARAPGHEPEGARSRA